MAGLQLHSLVKLEPLQHQAGPQLLVSTSPTHTQIPHCVTDTIHNQTPHADSLQATHFEVTQCQPPGQPQLETPTPMVAEASEGPPTAAALDPDAATIPVAARQHRQPSWTASEGPQAEAPSPSHEVNAQPPFSWGRRKPRTRNTARQSEDSTTDLATVAAAAIAEAEEAAASAVATARSEFAAASHSEAQWSQAKQHAQNGFRPHHHSPKSVLQPPGAGFGPSQAASGVLRGPQDPNLGHPSKAASGALRGPSDPNQGHPMQNPHQGVKRKGGPRSGRNHHRAGALPSNLNKRMGYIGSTFLGVNGVRHGAKFPLRWRAGTWDPLLKKTVYIGSYEAETDAAKAVDAWHVSQGRPPVNFTQPDAQLPEPPRNQPAAAAEAAQPVMADGSGSPSAAASDAHRDRHGNTHTQPAAGKSLHGSRDNIHHAARLLHSLRPAHNEDHACSESHQKADLWRPHFTHASNKSQRQSAAGALVANAVGRSKSAREGVRKHSMSRLHTSRSQSQGRSKSECGGVLFVDGKWCAQIRIAGDMHSLGRFANKEDAVQAHIVARRHNLSMHAA